MDSLNSEPQLLGHRLINYFKENGRSVSYYTACGSRPNSWMSTSGPANMCGYTSYDSITGEFEGGYKKSKLRLPHFSSLIEEKKPKSVVINLGDNMFEWDVRFNPRTSKLPSEQSFINEVRKMIGKVPEGSSCTWVGPIYHSEGSSYKKSNADVDQMYVMLKKALGSNCKLIDSRKVFSSTHKGDGLHLSASESKKWGDAIVGALSAQAPSNLSSSKNISGSGVVSGSSLESEVIE